MIALGKVFVDAGVSGAVHALDLNSGREVGHDADRLSVSASVFKVPVLVELCRQHAVGEIDAASSVPVPVESRAPGPFGLSIMSDPITASLRDLAWLMMGISDNAATDVICSHVGLGNVAATLRHLGLTETRVDGDCRDLFHTMKIDAGIESLDDFVVSAEVVGRLRALDPARTLHATTPRDSTRLLQLIWEDRAAPPAACAQARQILGQQVWPHRLASGFADEDTTTTSGKTGTLVMVRNEIGVVETSDGGRYAVAVFTRAESLSAKNAPADAVIGRAARLAVDELRGR